MRPFDLEAAKRGEPIITRDGREAKFIAHVPEAKEEHRVIVLVERNPLPAHETGEYFDIRVGESKNDLFMAPKKRKVAGWVNVYPSGDFFGHTTEDEAEYFGGPSRIGRKAHFVTFEIEE